MKNSRVILILLAIIILGAILRIYDLGAESLWYDEASSVHGSSQGLATVIEGSGERHNTPPLYFTLLHFWILLFGTGEAAIRSLSAIFGIVSIFLMYKVGSELFSQKAGLISSFILSISYFHIFYSQETRGYSLLLMLTLLSFYLFNKVLKSDNQGKYFALLLLANISLAYTHVYGLLVIASQIFFFLLSWSKYRQQRARFLTVQIATAAIFSLWIPTLLERTSGLLGGFEIPTTSLDTFVNTIKRYSGYQWGEQYLFLVFLLLCFIGLLAIIKRKKKWTWRKPFQRISLSPEPGRAVLLLLIWFAFSIIIPSIFAQFFITKYYPRYTIAALPAFYLLAARGISGFDRKWLIYPVLLVITALSLPGLNYYYTQNVKEEWQEAVVFIESNSQANDVIIISSEHTRKPFDYYYDGDLERIGVHRDVAGHTRLAAIVNEVVTGKERLWLVLSHAGADYIQDYLMERYSSDSIIAKQRYKGIEVYLFDLPFSGEEQVPEDTFTRGLVGYWAMEEGSGQYTHDGSGNNNDGRLGSNDGEAGDQADPQWTIGKIGNALLFDGKDDYVDSGSDQSLDITGPITIEAWIYLNKTPSSAGHDFKIVYKRDASRGYQMRLRAEQSALRADFKGLSDDYLSYFTGTNLEKDRWYHVAVIWDGSLMRSYVNGALDLVDDSSGTIASGPDINLIISHPKYGFNGIIDEVRIYNRALSGEEIRYHYNSGGSN